MPQVTILSQSCKGVEDCGLCLHVCPQGLFSPSEQTNQAGLVPPRLEDAQSCTGCENCMLYCPDLAIVVEKGRREAKP